MAVENGTGVSRHQPIGADPVLAEEAVGTAPRLAGRERVAGDEKTTPVACGFKPLTSVGFSQLESVPADSDAAAAAARYTLLVAHRRWRTGMTV